MSGRVERRREIPGSPDRSRVVVVSLALGAVTSLVVLGLLLFEVLQPVESSMMNLLVKLDGPRTPDERVVIVAIDKASVDALGRWPWPRGCIADVIHKILDGRARTIALDIVFSTRSRTCGGVPPAGVGGASEEAAEGEASLDGADVAEGERLAEDDEKLREAIERDGKVVVGFFLRRAEDESDPPAAEPTSSTASPAREANFGDCAAPPPLPGARQRGDLSAPGIRGPEVFDDVERNIAPFQQAAAGHGFFTHERTVGVQQSYNLLHGLRGDDKELVLFPALALEAVAHFKGEELKVESALFDRGRVRLGEDAMVTDEGVRLWLDYSRPWKKSRPGGYETLSIAEVWEMNQDELVEAFEDKLVFIGATEVGIGDQVYTPYKEMPGVEVHANAAGNLLSPDRQLRDGTLQALISFVVIFAFGLLVPLLVANVQRHLTGSLIAIAAVFAWPVLCAVVFLSLRWHLQVVAPMLAGGLALVASLRYQVGTVDARARRVKGLFQRYVSPEVVEELLGRETVALGGEAREMTVLFCDIRGFTDMSEQLGDSTAVVAVLNEFFTPMTELVLDEGGTLDKYMGDAMMAFFGAPLEQPDHAARACVSALAMRQRLVGLNERWRAEGKPAVGIGIGLNSGEMTVGNMGSEQVFDYTVIGDAVNLGSRIEGLNKVYGTEVLVSGFSRDAAGDGFLFRELDRVRVKGKTEAVTLHELMAAEPAPAEVRERAERFAAALALYRGQRFEEAEAAFAELAAAGDGSAKLYVERCARYRAEPPPEGWDGVETFTSK